MAELAESITDLSDGGRSTSAPADTLGSSIAWTSQFLDDDARTALGRLGIFRGSFEIDAATAIVTGRPLDARTAALSIRRLLDEHVVSLEPSSGRVVLSKEIRDFAADLLAAGDDHAATAMRHGAWYAHLAERFGAGGDDMPDSVLEPDVTDLVAALDAAMAGPDPTIAYRIIVGVGARLARLGHADRLDEAARWVAARSPSDGEDRWSAAVAQLTAALADEPDHALHAYLCEALAIAELGRDADTAARLRSTAEVLTARTSVATNTATRPATRQD